MTCSCRLLPIVASLLLLIPPHSHAQDQGSVCTNGDVRLIGGKSLLEGRVEFCYDNTWGTICDDGWDDNDAQVVCRQLGDGFSDVGARAIIGTGIGRYNPGTGPIYFDEVRCTGSEAALVNCSSSGRGVHNCDHTEDAGVSCEAAGFSCTNGELRLEGGNTTYDGRVEVCVDNKFTTVCDDNTWGQEEAQVVCRQLNFTADGVPIPIRGTTFGIGIGEIQLTGLQCTGSESNLTACVSNPTFFSIFCSHFFDDAGVLCPQPNPPCENGDIRLVNGRIPSEGRIEICFNGHWGTICHDGWDNREAQVVCGQLGYPRNNSLAIGYGDFGSGEGFIHLSNIICDGTEDTLFDCGASPVGQHFCHHGEDAGVICEDANNTCTDGAMRLADGESPNEGRLEVCYFNHWGTVCDDNFGTEEAQLVCRELGFPEEGAIGLHVAFFGQGVGIIFVDDTECIGNESSILDCSHLGIGTSNCFHIEDVSVLCQGPNSTCTNGEIRLVNGSGSHAGRVEVCFNGRWGTVCDDTFGVDDATVVCRQLNFPGEGAIALGGAYFGAGTGPIFLDDTECLPENHTLLQECFVGATIGQHNCDHSEDASVICPAGNQSCGEYSNGALRLVDGPTSYEGRVELCIDGEWGTICDNFWSDLDAVVVCRQLSLGLSDAMAVSGARYGQGNGTVHLDRFFCSGDERYLTDCIHRAATNCPHSQDAGVVCSAEQCEEGMIRLVGGQLPTEGRVEICIDGQYDTVCDDLWDAKDATVVCRQLGYSDQNAIALPSAFFGLGSRGIALDDVQCIGNESHLLDCDHLPNPTFCFHFEDAGVLCEPINSSCTNGEIRLAGGSAPWEGNVEVCFSGRWGTICHDRWDRVDAQTTCRLLGFGNGSMAIPTRRGFFGIQSDRPIFLDEVRCLGNETGILQCASVDVGDHNCNHFLDAGVICSVTNSSFDCQTGDIRLVSGQDEYEGRVEVCINGEWGTVCDDRWGSQEAAVVCRQLGLDPTGALAFGNAFYGPGTGDIYLSNLNCRGNESNLIDCPGLGPGSFCFHREDAGVRCRAPGLPPCADGELRLFGGDEPTEGTVEVCQSGAWQGSTICDDLWDTADAAVVCRQLGYESNGAIPVRGAFFGQGNGLILYNAFGCLGNESHLLNCTFRTFSFCTHREDAGVICPSGASRNCTTGDVRLRGGSNIYEGRVEVCLHGYWGTVCDDSWDSLDATVVCNQLGYNDSGYAAAVSRAHFGQGDGRIVLDDVRCVGNESRLLNCRAEQTGVHNCAPSEDAGVFCPSPSLACSNGEIRLVDGESADQGRVEVCLGGQWGTVCADSFWDNSDAQVVCRQLGYENPDGVSTTVGGGSGPIYASQLQCTGNEARLIDCPGPEFSLTSSFCTHVIDAGVVCNISASRCEEGAIRLVGGVAENLGRVEVCFGNLWGSVCDDGFDSNEAQVVCRQLGYTNYQQSVVVRNGFFGQGQTAIHLDDLDCDGTEGRLADCDHIGVGNHNCAHFEDVGVICHADGGTCEYGELRLVGGTSDREGRVEICIGGLWGTICDDNYDRQDAKVICRQLGFNTAGAYATDTRLFGQGIGLIFLDELTCTGNETRLINCPSNEVGVHNCLHSEDIGVSCAAQGCTNGDIRLINGDTNNEGTIEICITGVWGTICDDLWDNKEAQVACRQLGFQAEGAIAVRGAFFGAGGGNIQLTNFGCQGNEEKLVNCSSTTPLNCFHFEDAGVICPPDITPNCTTGAVRLEDGTNQYEGRVEMCLNGRWGTICDDSWDSKDATVVCRQLGYNTTAGRPFGIHANFIFGRGSGFIALDEVNCTGTESNLISCRASEKGDHDCSPVEDAGVLCPYEGSPCVSGEIRLNNNGTINRESGVVEVCAGGRWTNICAGLFFGNSEARVICRQLGHTNPENAISAVQSNFALTSDEVLLKEPICQGNEEHIFDCDVNPRPDFFCDFHLSDAAVFCDVPVDNCTEGDVRLVNGVLPNEGRVEICFNNQWGTVCDDSWEAAEAQVVCRQLNYTFHLQDSIPFTNAAFGSGLTAIHLDDLNCTGTERRLADCHHSGVGNHNCLHHEDAGVLCIVNNAACEHGDLRLVGGNSSQGRVEICIGGRWGTICNDRWDETDASVACKQLGFSPEGAIATNAIVIFGTGVGPIFLDELQCTGTEGRLLDCPSDGLGRHNCVHSEDVAVICNRTQPVTPSPFCNSGDLRLFGGEADNEGTLELCLNQAWGTVCDDLWDNNDAKVACRKLGFQTEGAIALRGGFFGQGAGPIQISNLRCTGNETSLLDCAHRRNPFCFHFEDAGIICPPRVPYNCTTGAVRLRDGNTEYEGRVEVCLHGRWGSVCDDNWDSRDAQVVCRQLNYLAGGVAFAVHRAAFGPGPGVIFLDEVQCVGNESTLLGCRASELGSHNCLPTEDAGVICPNPLASCNNGDVRLVDGSDRFEGRVELCIGGTWGTVCQDVFWDDADAQVICRQVGYTNPREALAVTAGDYGVGTGPIYLNGLNCTGNETRITDCQNINSGGLRFCSHADDVGVICRGSNVSICTDGQVRLVNSDFENEGRVEVCVNNNWGTVCDDDWDVLEAQVVCRQLNFSNGIGAVPVPRGFFGAGTGRIHLDDLGCNGTEQNLLRCSHRGIGAHNCGHFEDAGVICQVSNPRCEHGSLRLVGGSTNLEGRVEICLGGRWGTVCDDQWDNTDASVVCKQLGYSSNGAIATGSASFGRGDGPIFMDDTRCTGNETQLILCPSSGIGSHNCLHFEDAGAICQPIPCSENSARLSGGLNEYSGRVEICKNQEWGEVCSNGFGTDAAVAVCRSLGLDTIPSDAIIAQGRLFEQAENSMPTYNIMDACDNGTCNFTSVREERQCSGANNKAGLFCRYQNVTDICTTGDVRLMGRNSTSEGRVEICLNNQWGTVCDDSWDERGAAVVCRQLGYSYEGEGTEDSYGTATGPIFLDNIKCNGSEAHILSCPQLPLNTPHDCKHSEDVAIKCSTATGCSNGDVRLVNGDPGRGRVEICSGNSWGTICNDDWDESEAVVVCRQLNFNNGQGAVITPRGFFGSGSSEPQVNAGTLTCQRSEQTVDQCSQSGAGNGTCEQRDVAGVICQAQGSSPVCTHGDIRLAGGTNLNGRVEVCLAGQWGSVCADNWNTSAASVACRQLGFKAVGAVATQFNRGNAPTLMRNTQCSGGETELFQCRSSGIGVRNCPRSQQAGVTCLSRCIEDSVRLVGGLNQFNGRVEVCKDGSWAAVCKTGFGSGEARAVCSNLGLDTSTVVTTLGQIFQQSTDQMQMTYSLTASCSDGACNFTSTEMNSQCTEMDKAGVFCPRNFSSSEPKICNSGEIRLTGGSQRSEGRLEACLDNQWGTVCDDSWDDKATAVVCRQLGYQTEGAKTFRGEMYGQAKGPILLDDVKCRGTEENIFNCPQRQLGVSNNCQHSEDVGIQCIVQVSTKEPPKDMTTKEPPKTGGQSQSSANLTAIVIPLILIIVLLILIIIVIVIIVLVYRARKVGKLSFREYDDTTPMALSQSTSFSESLSKDDIPLEEKSDLAAL